MKPTQLALTAMAGVLALLNSPLAAQDNPAPPASTPPPPAEKASPPEEKAPRPFRAEDRGDRGRERERNRGPARPRDREEPRGPHGVEKKKVAFIGVLTEALPREMGSHFSLPEGFGLLVHEVMPDSPAQAAGLKKNDVLVKLDDQQLVNMEQLQTLVRHKRKDDVVSFTVISGGAEKQVTVTVSEKEMPVAALDPRRGGWPGSPNFGNERDMAERMKELRERAERMMESRERAREGHWPPSWRGSDRYDSRDRDPRGKGGEEKKKDSADSELPEKEKKAAQAEARGTTSITRSDDSGVYSLKKEGGTSIFTAKPKDGQEQSWNVGSDEERSRIPEPIRQKLKQLEEIRGGEAVPGAAKKAGDI